MSKTVIPAMPAEMTWTEDQWKAIWATEQDVLVAAAAGSGKTAVLVNRIINKLLSGHTNVDELLVVTFTNASAAEMRHRISDALEGAIQKNPGSQHLRRQLSLMNRASISTLHSFCLEVIRKYYYEIEIDPGFRIADSTEAELLKDEMIDDLLEEQYGIEENESFFRLVDAFSSDRNDIELQNIIRTLHEFSSSHPYPAQWLDTMISMYEVGEETTIDELPFMESLRLYVNLQIAAAKDHFAEGLSLTKLPAGPAGRAETFLKDLEIIEKLESSSGQSWNALYEAMSSLKFSTLKKASGDFDKNLDEQCKKARDAGKKLLQGLQKELFARRPESYLKDIRELKGYVEMLVFLVKQFKERYAAEKRERGIVDFSDLEHYCLDILTEQAEDGKVVPSGIALKYRSRFKEVLVDEYQDTNLVQETILKMVSKDDEENGNMFMVGDVKQSIYRFRLAEPNLFLGKYVRFKHDGKDGGLRIDLNKNFRSRKEVLDGTNFLFKQIMGVTVGEIEYDEDAELKKGAPYPEEEPFPIEVYYIDQKGQAEEEPSDEEAAFEKEELEKAQLESRLLADTIKRMVKEKRQITDMKTGISRAITYRDIVILMRSMTWAPEIMEEFKKQGIPIYANLSTGYFEATEVAIMMSLLKIIDNPLQDIPLASVLRSPIVGLDEEQLAQIKIAQPADTFFGSLSGFCEKGESAENASFYKKAAKFCAKLEEWRELAQQRSLSELIWQLYRDTKFYDYAGGMPGGKQRQANLRALFDRARQYEESSFRGLFRFLRFIERMQDRGNDLGAARALSEQEDVVRIMTIHSSKGLEFPVVLVAGLSREFNMMDLKKSYLLDKEYGFACRYTNPELRITYPSLPQIAFKKKKHLELIAEEMRVLYVALTRAKEKLILIGTLKDMESSFGKWRRTETHEEWLLKDYVRAQAKSYNDWIGPALARHRDVQQVLGTFPHAQDISSHPSNWKVTCVDASQLKRSEEGEKILHQDIMQLVKDAQPIPEGPVEALEKIRSQLDWSYAHGAAVNHMSKQSVTEIKRQREFTQRDDSLQLIDRPSSLHDRPLFMQQKAITAAEKGTIMHLVMQHVDVRSPITEETLEQLKMDLVQREFLLPEQIEAINNEGILRFFETEIGQRLRNAERIQREVPFNSVIPAKEAYKDWEGEDEHILVQGVIDCLFEDEQGYVLLDYKTDRIEGRFPGGFEQAKPVLADRYKVQIELYAKAIEKILGIKLQNKYLYFFDDGGHLLEMDE